MPPAPTSMRSRRQPLRAVAAPRAGERALAHVLEPGLLGEGAKLGRLEAEPEIRLLLAKRLVAMVLVVDHEHRAARRLIARGAGELDDRSDRLGGDGRVMKDSRREHRVGSGAVEGLGELGTVELAFDERDVLETPLGGAQPRELDLRVGAIHGEGDDFSTQHTLSSATPPLDVSSCVSRTLLTLALCTCTLHVCL